MKGSKALVAALSMLAMLSIVAVSSAEAKPITIKSVPYTITVPGTYVLGRSLSMGTTDTAITINANDVSLDLSGYGLTGLGAGTGVAVNGQRIDVKNGYITNFSVGISDNSVSCTDNRYYNLRIYSNHGNGMSLNGYGAIVKDCQIIDNQGDGIKVNGVSCSIEGNAIRGNSDGSGINCTGTTGTQIINNMVDYNVDWGINCGGGETIIGNTANHNDTGGINAPNCALVTNNSCMHNGIGPLYNNNIVYGGGCSTTGYVNYTN